MIIRTWHGRTRLSDADAYESFMKNRAAPDYGSVEGLQQLFFTRRDEGDISHFLLITVWGSIEAVKNFAGDDPSVAKYYPEDDEFLLGKEACSLNHQVFYQSKDDINNGRLYYLERPCIGDLVTATKRINQ